MSDTHVCEVEKGSSSEEFEVFQLDESEAASVVEDNKYIENIMNNSFLSLLQPNRAQGAFVKDHEKGLFHLFLSPTFWSGVLQWTNASRHKKGKKQICMDQLQAFIGLELAMSIVKIGSICAYWERARFSGHGDFSDTMSRNDFQEVRASIQFHPPITDGHSISTADPLWHCRCLLEHFQQNCANVAVPLGSSALDEASCRTKGRTRAKSYMPNKPIRYGIRFYACVGTREMYCHSFWDNGSGNKLPSTAGERYTRLFHGLRAPFDKGYAQDPEGKLSGVAKKSASALWSLQMLHQTHKQKDPSGKRHLYMDNFYTRHNLAEKVKQLSDQEIRITGTCRLNVIDKFNKVGVKAAINLLRDEERGMCCSTATSSSLLTCWSSSFWA